MIIYTRSERYAKNQKKNERYVSNIRVRADLGLCLINGLKSDFLTLKKLV